MIKPVIALHGGAGVITQRTISLEQENAHRIALEEALQIGSRILERGGNACEAVEMAVASLEDCPLFNAGKGSVFTNKGVHEMDASIMDGATLNAGAVSKIASVRNPVRMARRVMETSEYTYLSGREALDFAELHEIDFEDNEYFFQQNRYDQLLVAQNIGKAKLDHSEMPSSVTNGNTPIGGGAHDTPELPDEPDDKFGTVGAVALDQHGNLAAATSTGGLTNKKYGRVGDSAIVGAGTYANNATCAVSCTGYGEYFIRTVASHDVSCLMEYKGLSLQEACNTVLFDKIGKLGGLGGMIALDTRGTVYFCFNTEGMYRAYQTMGDSPVIKIYKD